MGCSGNPWGPNSEIPHNNRSLRLVFAKKPKTSYPIHGDIVPTLSFNEGLSLLTSIGGKDMDPAKMLTPMKSLSSKIADIENSRLEAA